MPVRLTQMAFYKSLGNPAFYPMAGHNYLTSIADEPTVVEVTKVEPAKDIDDDIVSYKTPDGVEHTITAQGFITVLGATATGLRLVKEGM